MDWTVRGGGSEGEEARNPVAYLEEKGTNVRPTENPPGMLWRSLQRRLLLT